jgi:hypothetical protein
MSLKSMPIPPVPEETARVAQAVFPRGNVLMQLRETLGTIYTDEQFADLFPTHGQPAEAPWRLALVTVFGLHGALDGSAGGFRRPKPTGLEVCPGAPCGAW